MQACSQNIAAPFGTEGFDIKIYGHFFQEGVIKTPEGMQPIDHRMLFDYHQVAGETEKDAALAALAEHRRLYPNYRPTCVEVGGCRQTPGAGRIYFFEGKTPLENYEENSRGTVEV